MYVSPNWVLSSCICGNKCRAERTGCNARCLSLRMRMKESDISLATHATNDATYHGEVPPVHVKRGTDVSADVDVKFARLRSRQRQSAPLA